MNGLSALAAGLTNVLTETEAAESSENTIVIDTVTKYANGLTMQDGVTYTAPDGYLLTMTVNGVETEIKAGTYEGTVVLTPTRVISESSLTASSRRNYTETYRAAVTTGADGYNADASVGGFNQAIIGSGTYDPTTGTFSNYTIKSGSGETANGSPQFSGFIFNAIGVSKEQNYTIKDSVIELYTEADGTPTGSNDFTGLGTAIIATGAVNLTLDNVAIQTSGVAKSGLVTSGVGSGSDLDKSLNAADVLVKNSTLVSEGGTLYDGYINTADTSVMVSPPWVLGFQGNARTTNLLGYYATNTYVDSTMKAAGWAVLSTDGCTAVKHTVINSELINTNRKNGGYGVYAIGSGSEAGFYGATLDVATYGAVIREGDITFASYTAGDEKNITKLDEAETIAFSNVKSNELTSGTKASTIDAQFGVMFHASGGNTLNVVEGTTFNTQNAAFLVRSLPVTINVDDAEINTEDGVILQQMDDEDGGNVDVSMSGGGPTFGDFTETTGEDGWPAFKTTGTAGTGAVANFSDVSLKGDIYNSTGIITTGKDLTVNLGEDATLEGVITSSLAAHVWMEWNEEAQRFDYMHDISSVPAEYSDTATEIEVDGVTYIQAGAYDIDYHYNIGHVVNKATNASNQNPVNVALTDGAVWTVTGTSYINKLTIDSESSIVGANGASVKISVDGTAMSVAEIVEAGTVTGDIVISVVTQEPSSWVIRGTDPDVEQRILNNSVYVINGLDTTDTTDDLIVDNRNASEQGTSTYSSTSDNGSSAIYVTNRAAAEFSDFTAYGYGTMSSSDLTDELASKYGYASAVLVNNGATLTLNNPMIYGIEGSRANGAYASDAGSTLNVNGGIIETNNNLGHGLDATYGGTINAKDVSIYTQGSNSAAIATDFQGGYITAEGIKAVTEYAGSPGIYAAGNSVITVKSSDITANGTEGVMVAHDGGHTYLYDTNVTGTIGLNSHNSMVPAYSYLEMYGGSLTSTNGSLITVSGGMADMTIDDVDLVIAEGYDFIGAKAGSLIVNANNMGTIDGNVTMDGTTYLALNLTNSELNGTVNASKLSLASASWTVTGTSYLSELSIDAASTIAGANDGSITIVVDGVPMSVAEVIEAGTVTGGIVVAEVTSIKIDSAAIVTLRKGNTLQLTVTAAPSDVAAPVIWTSSNESIATVDENGWVNAVVTGNVIIKATTADGKLISSVTIRVTP